MQRYRADWFEFKEVNGEDAYSSVEAVIVAESPGSPSSGLLALLSSARSPEPKKTHGAVNQRLQ